MLHLCLNVLWDRAPGQPCGGTCCKLLPRYSCVVGSCPAKSTFDFAPHVLCPGPPQKVLSGCVLHPLRAYLCGESNTRCPFESSSFAPAALTEAC